MAKKTNEKKQTAKEDVKPSSPATIGPNTELDLTFTWAQVEPVWTKQVAKIARRLNLPGFRKGNVPPAIAEREVETNAIVESVLQELLPAAYSELVTSNKKQPLGDPEFQIVAAVKGADWKITVHIAEAPQVALKNYQKVVKAAKKEADKQWTELQKAEKKAKTDNKTKKDEPKQAEAPEPTAEQTAARQRQLTLQTIYQHLLKEYAPTIPELLVKRETRRELEQLVRQLDEIKVSLDDFLVGKRQTFEQLTTNIATRAAGQLQLEFILQAVITTEKITVEQADVDAVLAQTKDEAQRAEQANNPDFMRAATSYLLKEKAVEYLLKI